MRIRSNPHTHTTFSDGRDTPRAQAEQALRLGFRALGFTDHSVQAADAFVGIPQAREAGLPPRGARPGRGIRRPPLRISLGIELDASFGIADAKGYDYILLSGHYACKGGARAIVDSRPRRADIFALRDGQYGGDRRSPCR